MKGIKSSIACIGIALAAFTACNSAQTENSLTVSGLDPAAFDTTINQKPVKLYTLKNASGMEVCITNFGGRVVSLVVPDKNGKSTDVVLGYDNIAQYADTVNSPSDFGSAVGRYANRINKGKSLSTDRKSSFRPITSATVCTEDRQDGCTKYMMQANLTTQPCS